MKSVFQYNSPNIDKSFVVQEFLQPRFTSPFHFHDTYELIHIVKSYGKLYTGDRILNFKDGEVYFFGPGLAHCFYNDRSFIETGQTAHAIVVFFKEDFMGPDFFRKPEMSKIKMLLNASRVGVKLEKNDESYTTLFRSITKHKGADAFLLLIQMLNQLSNEKKADIGSIAAYDLKDMSSPDTERLLSVFRYVLDNFKGKVASKHAASLAFLNEAAFCRYFKRRTGKTFSQYVNSVRISHAAKLLYEKDWNIVNICYECGYNSISYFNREFKLQIGLTPVEYRKRYIELNEDPTIFLEPQYIA